VKFLTGGNCLTSRSPRALYFIKVSRFGVNPKPTVTVWMEEKNISLLLFIN
jgi:hypothetical protein